MLDASGAVGPATTGFPAICCAAPTTSPSGSAQHREAADDPGFPCGTAAISVFAQTRSRIRRRKTKNPGSRPGFFLRIGMENQKVTLQVFKVPDCRRRESVTRSFQAPFKASLERLTAYVCTTLGAVSKRSTALST